MLRKNEPFIWGDAQQEAFETLKQKLLEEPILVSPDFSREFWVVTDASDYALGAVLEQKDDEGKEHVVAYASKLLNNSQVKWDSSHKELAAIIFATQ